MSWQNNFEQDDLETVDFGKDLILFALDCSEEMWKGSLNQVS
jgi:hypothetical protein